MAINHTETVLQPKQETYNNFKNFKQLLKTPFIIYGDFESILKSAT